MSADHNANTEPAALIRHLSPQRFDGYLSHCHGDPQAALNLYQWNAEVAGALWETLGHLEIALRNTLAERLAARHTQLMRLGSWLDDPVGEFDSNARSDIAKARRRVINKHKPASDGQTISELTFGFWRFLLARRYTTTLWPSIASAFPYSPDRDRRTVEAPVTRLHALRNRLAHHERIWNQPLDGLYSDIFTLCGYIDPHLAYWVRQHSRVPVVLAGRPATRPPG